MASQECAVKPLSKPKANAERLDGPRLVAQITRFDGCTMQHVA
jgi:hypothetical protein